MNVNSWSFLFGCEGDDPVNHFKFYKPHYILVGADLTSAKKVTFLVSNLP